MNATYAAILAMFVAGLLPRSADAQVADAAPAGDPAAAVAPSAPPAAPETELPVQPPGAPGPGAGFPNLPPDLPNLVAPAPAGLEGMRDPARQRSRGRSVNPLLTLFDTDGDGTLSGDEVEEAPARLWELDRDFNAELTADELGAALLRRPTTRRPGIPGHLPVEVEPAQSESTLPALPNAGQRSEGSRFQVYPLRSLDPNRVLAALKQVFRGQPEVRLTLDARTRSLLALAPSDAHATIRETLATLLEGERAGIPGIVPEGEAAASAAGAMLPVVPRSVPLYNMQAREVLGVVRRVYRDKITEPPAATAAPGNALGELPPVPEEPVVPEGKMVIGLGADPNTIVISAEDELFFEVLDLIERLDGAPPEEDEALPPPRD